MLNFLNPTILIALTAAVIPILIHLLNRQKKMEIRFSTVVFLKKLARKEMRRLKLRQFLLLLIRTLIIAFLVLSFARPSLKQETVYVSGNSATEAVVIVDNSLSMNRLNFTGNLLANARQWWLNLAQIFKVGDRISVIFGVSPLQVLAERENYSSSLWEKVAKEIQPSYLSTDLNEATFKALDIFEKSHLANRELFYISDFQQSVFNIQKSLARENKSLENLKIYYLPVKTSQSENISLDSVRLVNQLIEKNQVLAIEVFVKNRNGEKKLNSLVSLIINNARIAQKNVDLDPDQLRRLKFETVLNASGFVDGFIECENDDLLEDNRTYFNFFVPEHLKILHLVPDSNFESFIPIILKPAIEQEIFDYTKKYLIDWKDISILPYQAIILEGIDQIPDGLIDRIKQYMDAGNSLLIIPGDRISQTNYNMLLKKTKVGQIMSRRGKPGEFKSFVSMGKIDWNHPIFEGLFESRKQLNPTNFYGYYLMQPSVKGEIIISLENGDPLLVMAQDKEGYSYLLTTPLQPDWTNLVVKGFVVPLIFRMMYYAASEDDVGSTALLAGEPFIEIFRRLDPPYDFKLHYPNGLEELLSPIFRGSNILLQVEQNQHVGNHHISKSGKIVSVYSVNHNPLESTNLYYDKSDLMNILGNGIWIDPEDDLAKKVQNSRFGKELWPHLLSFVVFLLFVEMILAFTGQRKLGSQGQLLDIKTG